MKKYILCLSDTHSRHRQMPLEWLKFDFLTKEEREDMILIHAGDISNVGHLNDMEDFFDWYDSLEFNGKFFSGGNHDWGLQLKPKEVAEILKKYPTITYLQDSSVTIDGIKIYGSPWTPEFYNWAFNLKRGKELQDKWDLIDLDSDIICTHGPVYGILDKAPDGRLTGCENLLDTITTKLDACILHVCGHIHCGHGHVYAHDRTFVNASIVNEQYNVAYKPILIEFDKELKKATVIDY